jgi:hypothetical protein
LFEDLSIVKDSAIRFGSGFNAVYDSSSMALPHMLQQALGNGGFIDSDADGGMGWIPPFDSNHGQ